MRPELIEEITEAHSERYFDVDDSIILWETLIMPKFIKDLTEAFEDKLIDKHLLKSKRDITIFLEYENAIKAVKKDWRIMGGKVNE